MNKPIMPLTSRQQTMIVNNIKKVIDTKNIELLSKQAYNFLYLCSGFIAHYNLNGFKCYYENVDCLIRDILDNKYQNQWNNFNHGDKDYEYYMSKKKTYNAIIDSIFLYRLQGDF